MSNCYYSGAGNGSLCYELYDKTRLQPDRQVLSNVAEEMVQSMGQKIDYWINTTTTSGADTIYGEEPTSIYQGPIPMKMIINLNESSLSLSKFGFQSDDEVVGYLAFNNFYNSMSGQTIYNIIQQIIEPKSGDVFRMTEYGNDRVGGRSGNFFQITERRDQDIGDSINPLGGHYGWKITAKRLEYSWEPGLPQETANDQITDDSFYGKVSSTITDEVSSAPKSYSECADNDSKRFIIDMGVNDTSVYGTYDLNN